MLILNPKSPKFTRAREAQMMPNSSLKSLILNAKTRKFAPARMAQIMTNF